MYKIMLVNFIYVIFGSVLSLFISRIAVSYFDKTTPYNTQKELEEDNKAVGMVVSAIYIGVFLMMGLIIGLGLN